MKTKRLTKSQLDKIAKHHRFIAARWDDGEVTGINTKSFSGGVNANQSPESKSRIVSYRPIGFQEYLSLKIGFINCSTNNP